MARYAIASHAKRWPTLGAAARLRLRDGYQEPSPASLANPTMALTDNVW